MTQQQVAAGTVDLAAIGIRDTAHLTRIVTRCVGREVIELQDVSVDEVPYDLHAITTRCRQRVVGTALTKGQTVPFSIFVKVVQSWAHSPAFQSVPPELRAVAAKMLPWEVEPRAYQSELAAALPIGLRMPQTYDVIELDESSAAIWLEDIDIDDITWTAVHFRRAAELLGRFAVSPAVRAAVAPLGPLIGPRTVREYAGGRVAAMVIPALLGDELWSHPLVAGSFDSELRRRTLSLVDRLPALLDELDQLPSGVCHGDACSRNLLMTRSHHDLVMIDFGFLRYAPLGFDLSQLILGEIQLGERDPDQLEAIGEVAFGAYVDGLRQAGSQANVDQVRRAHAISMAIFSGLSAIPFELLGEPPTDRVRQIFAARAAVARYILDRVGC
jgi:hypothetical protein